MAVVVVGGGGEHPNVDETSGTSRQRRFPFYGRGKGGRGGSYGHAEGSWRVVAIVVVVVVVGVPDKVGASDGVTGAVTGICDPGGCAVGGGSADIATQVSQSTAQSQMSPSE